MYGKRCGDSRQSEGEAHPTPATVLIVEDDEFMRASLEDRLELEEMSYLAAADYQQAVSRLAAGSVDLVVADIRLPDGSGADLFEHIRGHHPGLPVILMTAYGDIADAVALVKSGAVDYLTKPFDLSDLIELLRSEIRQIMEARIVEWAGGAARSYVPGSGILGVSPQMRGVERLIARLRNSDSSVLITGESGVGKEVVATMVHANSPRRDGPMVRVSCAALAPGLIESELFGHEKGAFTGAHQRRAGRFEQANGGTIFLDEIAEIPPEIQVKLLRVLQEREVERVGCQELVPLDVRVIAATQVDLESALEEGSFRTDLYYRINVIRIHIPPLRSRPEDIPFLARKFIRESAENHDGAVTGLTRAAEERLQAAKFRGNVRELKNQIERTLVMSAGPLITESDIGSPTEADFVSAEAPPQQTLRDRIEHAEREAIEVALAGNEWMVTRAARALGISRKSLWEKMKRLEIGR